MHKRFSAYKEPMPRKKKSNGGRPPEDRQRLVVYVQEPTLKAIRKEVDTSEEERKTPGRVLDLWARERQTAAK